MKKKKPDNQQAPVHKFKKLPDDLQKIWDMAEPKKSKRPLVNHHETEQALENVLDTLGLEKDEPNPFRLTKLFAVAATVLIAAFISYLSFYTHTYQSAPGEQLSVLLRDGSMVQLNGNSTLSHAPLFGYFHRDLELNGEAYFEVTSSETPFVVNAPTTQTTVLGTKFNISDWNQTNYLSAEVIVTEGEVSVNNYSESEVFLGMNEMGVMNSSTLELSKKSLSTEADLLNWTKGELQFSDVSLAQFFERLELHFGKEITLNGNRFETEGIQAHYKNSTALEDILSDISTVKNLSVEKTRDGFIVFD